MFAYSLTIKYKTEGWANISNVILSLRDSRGEEPPRVGVGSPKNPSVYSGFGMVIPNHLKQFQRESVKIVVSLL